MKKGFILLITIALSSKIVVARVYMNSGSVERSIAGFEKLAKHHKSGNYKTS